jgi:hypothetical protein
LIGILLVAGLNEINLSFTETMSNAGGFSFDYSAAATPLPAALPLFAAGLAALAFFGRCKKRKLKTLSYSA